MDELADFGGTDFGGLDDDFGDERGSICLTPSEEQAVARARALVEFAAGLEDAGHAETARRVRVAGRDVLELVEQLAAVRSSLVAMTADRDRWRDNRWREAHGERWPA